MVVRWSLCYLCTAFIDLSAFWSGPEVRPGLELARTHVTVPAIGELEVEEASWDGDDESDAEDVRVAASVSGAGSVDVGDIRSASNEVPVRRMSFVEFGALPDGALPAPQDPVQDDEEGEEPPDSELEFQGAARVPLFTRENPAGYCAFSPVETPTCCRMTYEECMTDMDVGGCIVPKDALSKPPAVRAAEVPEDKEVEAEVQQESESSGSGAGDISDEDAIIRLSRTCFAVHSDTLEQNVAIGEADIDSIRKHVVWDYYDPNADTSSLEDGHQEYSFENTNGQASLGPILSWISWCPAFFRDWINPAVKFDPQMLWCIQPSEHSCAAKCRNEHWNRRLQQFVPIVSSHEGNGGANNGEGTAFDSESNDGFLGAKDPNLSQPCAAFIFSCPVGEKCEFEGFNKKAKPARQAAKTPDEEVAATNEEVPKFGGMDLRYGASASADGAPASADGAPASADGTPGSIAPKPQLS